MGKCIGYSLVLEIHRGKGATTAYLENGRGELYGRSNGMRPARLQAWCGMRTPRVVAESASCFGIRETVCDTGVFSRSFRLPSQGGSLRCFRKAPCFLTTR